MIHSIRSIHQSFQTLRSIEKMRHRDIAKEIGMSEGELIAAFTGNNTIPSEAGQMQVIRLYPKWTEIMASIGSLGEVMALTRNASCVHEKVGVYKNASQDGPVGLLVGEIDLRIFYHAWAHGFAVRELTKDGLQRSLQFFDKAGVAIHKIYLRAQSCIAKYDELLNQFQSHDQAPGMQVTTPDKPATELPDQEIDVTAWRQSWRAMKDTHDFFVLLRQFKVTRTQGLRLAEPAFVQALPVSCVKDLLEIAASTATPLMVFVGNPGMLQIHSGSIHKVMSVGSWINVMDPRFNLHLRSDSVAQAWLVRKPTVDGIVTSVELFNDDGEAIAMFFGERKPGKPELSTWRALADDLLARSTAIEA
ncbi:hemin-degrading factor [Polynucleobacter difficilis]|uniref:hemin-degrading factor n=1 Tax=Polynucleobacter difficilis TaxID=556054 RepID=UPI0019013BE8|nr:ChuX/HutX family heme-like substrate-binding protein [Polynucleobacter difficilis]